MSEFNSDIRLRRQKWERWFFIGLGHLCLVTGVVGIFLPVLPTVPFILLASVCYARGSEKAYYWLMNHKFFGPPLQDWKRTRALPLRAKALAVALITLSAGISIYFLIPITWVKWFVAVTCSLVASYLCLGIPTRR